MFKYVVGRRWKANVCIARLEKANGRHCAGQMAAVCFLSGRSFQNPYLAQSTLRMSPVALKAVWKASEASSEWGMLPFLLSRR